MASNDYSLDRFVEDLRAAAGAGQTDRDIIRAVTPLARQMAENSASWLREEHYACYEGQGFGAHLLHEEPDHSLAVFAFSWLPGRGAPPHDHATWAVVAGVDGPERNVNWTRLDDGSEPGKARIEPRNEIVVKAAEVVSFLPDDIHSVHNDTDQVTVSFHVYGRHVNHTGRLVFDPAAETVEKFVISVE